MADDHELTRLGYRVLAQVVCGKGDSIRAGLLLERGSKLHSDRQQGGDATTSAGVLYIRCNDPCCSGRPLELHSAGGCIYSGNAFEAHAGRSYRKKWRETIRVLPRNISLKAWLTAVGRDSAGDAANDASPRLRDGLPEAAAAAAMPPERVLLGGDREARAAGAAVAPVARTPFDQQQLAPPGQAGLADSLLRPLVKEELRLDGSGSFLPTPSLGRMHAAREQQRRGLEPAAAATASPPPPAAATASGADAPVQQLVAALVGHPALAAVLAGGSGGDQPALLQLIAALLDPSQQAQSHPWAGARQGGTAAHLTGHALGPQPPPAPPKWPSELVQLVLLLLGATQQLAAQAESRAWQLDQLRQHVAALQTRVAALEGQAREPVTRQAGGRPRDGGAALALTVEALLDRSAEQASRQPRQPPPPEQPQQQSQPQQQQCGAQPPEQPQQTQQQPQPQQHEQHAAGDAADVALLMQLQQVFAATAWGGHSSSGGQPATRGPQPPSGGQQAKAEEEEGEAGRASPAAGRKRARAGNESGDMRGA